MLRFGPETIKSSSDDFSRAILRFQRLVEDLEYLARENRPNIAEDGQTPILEDWRLTVRPSPCLVGLSTGHPLLPGIRREVITSEVVALSPQLGWARTRSRWYHLGKRDGANWEDS